MWVLLSNVIYGARLCGTCQRSTVPDRFKCLSVPFLNASTGIKLPQSKCELPIWALSFKFHQAESVLYCLVFLKAAAGLFSFIWHLWIEIFSQNAHNIFPLISLKWTRKLRKTNMAAMHQKEWPNANHQQQPLQTKAWKQDFSFVACTQPSRWIDLFFSVHNMCENVPA